MVKRFSFCFSVSRRKTNLAATFLVWTFFYWNLMTRLTEILVTSANSQTVNLSAVISHFFTNFHHKIIALHIDGLSKREYVFCNWLPTVFETLKSVEILWFKKVISKSIFNCFVCFRCIFTQFQNKTRCTHVVH